MTRSILSLSLLLSLGVMTLGDVICDQENRACPDDSFCAQASLDRDKPYYTCVKTVTEGTCTYNECGDACTCPKDTFCYKDPKSPKYGCVHVTDDRESCYCMDGASLCLVEESMFPFPKHGCAPSATLSCGDRTCAYNEKCLNVDKWVDTSPLACYTQCKNYKDCVHVGFQMECNGDNVCGKRE